MSVYWLLSVLCVFVVCLCMISNHSTSKKRHYVSQLSKLDTLLHKTHIKVLRLDMCRSIISLSKITHQMWCYHPFSQRNKTTERTVGVGVGGNRERGGGWTKFQRGEVGNIGGGVFK